MSKSDSFAHLGQIAVVGIAARFPGAKNTTEFWQNLRAGVESVTFFSDEEMEAEGIPAALINHPKYVKANAVLDNPEMFDAAFFNINRKEAQIIDPQHRFFLECAWEALEDAGYDPARYQGRIGMYASESMNSYFLLNLYSNRELIQSLGSIQTVLGNDRDFLATRASFNFDLKGPSIVVQSACSSSLVAVHLACQSLTCRECDMALAGGVSISLPQKAGYMFQEGGIYSPDGHCRAFDARAGGTVGGNGVGVVVLKRLDDALADGDEIHAVIKGSAINNDGSLKVGYTAPSVEGQARVIAEALAVARIDPSTISYVEAHGTGTQLGDPVEIEALTQAFRHSTDRKNFCAVGSVKTNLGHLDAAAGVAGLIKTVLALRHKELPPSLHFDQPNPKIDFAQSPFYINASLSDWQSDRPRRAGVSSFGIGGTNAHVVLEEAPARKTSAASRPYQLLVVSAKTGPALESATANLLRYFKQHPDSQLADVAYTLQIGRRNFNHARMLVCRTAEDGVTALETNCFATHVRESQAPAVVFMFPGQGTQYVNMGRELYDLEPQYRHEVDHCAKLLKPHLGIDIREVIYPSAEKAEAADQQLKETALTQPALFVTEYALAKLLMNWDVRPEAMIGHSLGEYVAACLAEVFSLEDALALVAVRGRMMQALPGGAMLSVQLSEAEIQPLLGDKLSVAAVNGSSLCSVSGPTTAIEALQKKLDELGIASSRLHTSHAFHSAAMNEIMEPFARQVRSISLKPPRIPYTSNLTGKWITAAEVTDASYWSRHLRQPVRFAEGLALLHNKPRSVLLEVGPGHTLSTLARRHPGKSAPVTISSLRAPDERKSDEEYLLETIGRLWLEGIAIDWPMMQMNEQGRLRVSLPTYPFQHQRYWIEPGKLKSSRNSAASETEEELGPSAVTAGAADDAYPLAGPGDAADRARRAEAQMSQIQMITPETDSNGKQRIWSALKSVITELTGADLAEIDPAATFFELGVDSLLLIQAAQAIEKRFGIELSFRQLLEDYPTLDALANYLEQHAFPAEQTDELSAPELPVALEPSEPRRQLALSSTAQSAGEQSVRNQAWRDSIAPLPATSTRSSGSVREGSRLTNERATADKIEQEPFVPFHTIRMGQPEGLTPLQQNRLSEFIGRYTKRTRKSKDLIQSSRGFHADSRLSLNYRQQWKDLVYPIVGERSLGARLWDVDDNEYLDLTMGFGVSLFGHSPPFLVQAFEQQIERGFQLGPQSSVAGEVAQLLCELTGMERAAFCNSGTEAIMAALRLARTATGRNKVALFTGSYHGSFDGILARAIRENGQLRAVPLSPGVPPSLIDDVIMLDYDRPESFEAIKAHAHELAAVLVEPVQSRRPDLQPAEFLRALRKLTEELGTILIFDEVITGFRLHPGGAQAWFGIRADLAVYGKIIGGGVPIGVVAGKSAIMDAIDGGMWSFADDSYPRAQQTYFAGTFFKNPLAMAGARAVLQHLKDSGPILQQQLNERTSELAAHFNNLFEQQSLGVSVVHCASLFRFNFPRDLKFADLFFYHLIDKGIYIWEGRNCFLSTAHTSDDLDYLFQSVEQTVAELRAGDFLPSVADYASRGENRRRQQTIEATQRSAVAPPSANAVSAGRLSGQNGEEIATSAKLFPLTEGQQQVWLASQMGKAASVAYNESINLHLRGRCNVAAMRQAIERLVERHESLRTTFSPLGDYQEIKPNAKVLVPLVDFSDLDEPQRQAQVTGWLAKEVQAPFDLAHGPLLRTHIARLEDEYHLLVLTIHHLVMDGWSAGVLLRELREIYSAECEGLECHLAPPESYREFALRLMTSEQSEEMAQAETFWLKQFADAIPVLNLPLDHPRAPAQTFKGDRQRAIINSGISQELKKLSAQQGCTTFVTLLVAFSVVLRQLSSQDDFIVGIHSAGQLTSNAKDLIGYCINLLPFRTRIDDALSFTEYLAQVRRELLDVYSHQNYPLGKLIKKLNPPRDPSRSPLIAVTFNVDRAGQKAKFYGLEVEVVVTHNGHSKFDLSVNLIEETDHLEMECDYNTDLFESETVRRWMTSFEMTLRALMSNPTIRLKELKEIIEEAGRHEQQLKEKEFRESRRQKLKKLKRRAKV